MSSHGLPLSWCRNLLQLMLPSDAVQSQATPGLVSRPTAAYAAYSDAVQPQASPGLVLHPQAAYAVYSDAVQPQAPHPRLVSRPPAAYAANTNDAVHTRLPLGWFNAPPPQLMLPIIMKLSSHRFP